VVVDGTGSDAFCGEFREVSEDTGDGFACSDSLTEFGSAAACREADSGGRGGSRFSDGGLTRVVCEVA